MYLVQHWLYSLAPHSSAVSFSRPLDLLEPQFPLQGENDSFLEVVASSLTQSMAAALMVS